MMKKGFTLIELLVVISIIGILAAMIVVSFTSSQRQARDVQRKSDLSQYKNSLEAYGNSTNGLYPVFVSTIAASGSLCDALRTAGVITGNCPEDPYKNLSGRIYNYQSNAGGTSYVLWATLENTANTFWVTCSSGQSGKISSATSINGGSCPAGLTQ